MPTRVTIITTTLLNSVTIIIPPTIRTTRHQTPAAIKEDVHVEHLIVSVEEMQTAPVTNLTPSG